MHFLGVLNITTTPRFQDWRRGPRGQERPPQHWGQPTCHPLGTPSGPRHSALHAVPHLYALLCPDLLCSALYCTVHITALQCSAHHCTAVHITALQCTAPHDAIAASLGHGPTLSTPTMLSRPRPCMVYSVQATALYGV